MGVKRAMITCHDAAFAVGQLAAPGHHRRSAYVKLGFFVGVSVQLALGLDLCWLGKHTWFLGPWAPLLS